jgi:hypothetical protein
MLRLAKAWGLAAAAAHARQRIRLTLVQAALTAVAAVFIVGAAIFALVALYLWLARELDPISAAAIIAAIMLLIGIILLLVARRTPRAASVPNPAEDIGKAVHEGYKRFEQEARAAGVHPVLAAAGAAFVIGFLLGRR